ncbi:MAG: protein kinase [Planctomycetota bacterium]
MNDEAEVPKDDELLEFAGLIEGFQRESDDRIDDRVVGRIVAQALEDFHLEADKTRVNSAPKGQVGNSDQTIPAEECPPTLIGDQQQDENGSGGQGRTLGDYRLVKRLGEGGMGVVWEARHRSLGDRRFALKELQKDRQFRQSAIQRFIIEARVLARFDHDHIVPVYHIGHDEGIHYFVMKLIDGQNLAELIQAAGKKQRNGRRQKTVDNRASTHSLGRSKADTVVSHEILNQVSEKGSAASVPEFVDAVVRLGIQVAEALDHAHQMGVVHRDIKPANILVDRVGNAWIADFGLAHVINGNNNMTRTGGLVGTGPYMSPEQCLGTKRSILDQRTDIYSLGITIYELLTLRRAVPRGLSDPELLHQIQFEDPLPARRVDPRIPHDLEAIILRATRKRPGERYESAAAMAKDLERFAKGEPLPGGVRPTRWEKTKQWARTHRQSVAALAATFATALVAAALLAVFAYNVQANALAAESKQKENAVAEKSRVEKLLRRSEGLRLAANSALNLESDPTLAMLLAIEATKLHPGKEAHRALLRAINENHELKTLSGHRGPVGSIAFNHDGTRLVSTTTRDRFNSDAPSGAYLWDIASGELLHEFRDAGTTSSITSAVYSPDKVRILTTSTPPDGGTTSDEKDAEAGRPPRLWEDVTFGSLITFNDAHLFEASENVFDPEGRQIVLPAKENTARIFDCVRGTEVLRLEGHEKRVVQTAFGPAGKLVASASDDNTIRIWDGTSGKLIHKFEYWKEQLPLSNSCLIDTFEFRSDGRQLLTVSKELGVHLWDLTSGKRVESPTISDDAAFYWPDGMRFSTFTRTVGGEVNTHESARGDYLNSRSIPGYLKFVSISPDSKILALKTTNASRINFWNLSRPEIPAVEIPGNLVNCIRFSPDSKLIATGSGDETIKLWDLVNGRKRNTLADRASYQYGRAAIGPNDRTIAIPNNSGQVLGSASRFGDSQRSININGRVWVPDYAETRFLVSDQNRLAVHEIETAEMVASISYGPGQPRVVAIGPSGKHVAAYAGGNLVTLWFVDESKRIPLTVGERSVTNLSFTPDAKRLLTASEDGIVRVWDVSSGQELGSFSVNQRIFSLEVSRTEDRVVTVDDESHAEVWNLATFQREAHLESNDAEFTVAKLNFDGTLLLTYKEFDASSIIVWNVETASQIHRCPVEGRCDAAVHHDKNEAILCTDLGAEIWRFDTNERIKLIDQPRAFGAYAPDDDFIYTCSRIPFGEETASSVKLDSIPARLERWTPGDFQLDEQVDIPSGSPTQLFVGPNRRVLMGLFRRFVVELRDIDSGERISLLPGHFAEVSEILYTPDGLTLITVGRDARVHLWGIPEGRRLQTAHAHQSPITRAALTTDGKRLLTVDTDGDAVLWAVPTLQVLKQFSFEEKFISHLELDPSGTHALAVFPSGKLSIHDLEVNEPASLPFQVGPVAWAEYARQGSRILIIPRDSRKVDESEPDIQANYSVLVVPTDGHELRNYRFPSPIVTSHFHPNGRELVTLTRDGVISFTDIGSGESTKSIKSGLTRQLAAITDSKGKWLAIHQVGTISFWNLEDEIEWMQIGSGGVPLRSLSTQQKFVRTNYLDRFNPFLLNSNDWVIVGQGSVIRKVSFNLSVHQELAPRTLSKTEREQFLITE